MKNKPQQFNQFQMQKLFVFCLILPLLRKLTEQELVQVTPQKCLSLDHTFLFGKSYAITKTLSQEVMLHINTNPIFANTSGMGLQMDIVYDAMGNPTQYGNWDMTWVRGRLLRSMRPRNNVGYSWEFSYDENGIRYRKVQRNAANTQTLNTTTFYVDGTRIIAEESTRYGLIEYFYDAQGATGMRISGVLARYNPNAHEINNHNFLFIRDVLGNVIAVIRDDGVTVARYRYDAWGNVTVLDCLFNISHINPFRYRGYYVDRGTGLYYLQTRFYDPRTRRFINSDNFMLVPRLAQSRELNMFAYALNNPIRYIDPSGQLAITTIIVLSIIGAFAIAGAVTGGVVAYQNDQNVVAGVFLGLGIGLFVGGLVVATGGKAVSVLAGWGVKKIGGIKIATHVAKAAIKKTIVRGSLAMAAGGAISIIPGAFLGHNISLYGSSNKSAAMINGSQFRRPQSVLQNAMNMPFYYWLA